jgi:tripartite-type tricarboxylate transporter receptor subunit TctC
VRKPIILMSFLISQGILVASAAYPDRPIRLIVPNAPGGSPDTTARIFAAELTKQLGQQVVVDNRAGAGGIIGMTLVAKSIPDGYTIGYAPIAPIALQPSLQKNLPYDRDRELQAVVQISAQSAVLVASKSLSITSVQGIIDYARINPGKLLYASIGDGAYQHLTGELFSYMTKTSMRHVPFKGSVFALTDVIAGRVHLMFEVPISVGQHITSGRLQGIAVTGTKRVSAFKELPTVAEAGVPGFESTTWGGIVVQAKTPRTVVDQLNREFNVIMGFPHIKEKYLTFGADLVGGSPEQFTLVIKRDTIKWADVIKRAGIKAD